MAHSRRRITLPSMTPGTGRSIAVHRFGVAGGRPKVYLQAAIHANELPGAMALHHLMPMLVAADRAKRIRGEIVVVPTVNPIGLAQLVGNNHLAATTSLGARISTATGSTFQARLPSASATIWELMHART